MTMTQQVQKKAPEEKVVINPEIVERLARESQELGAAFRERIQKMWEISLDERQAKCR